MSQPSPRAPPPPNRAVAHRRHRGHTTEPRNESNPLANARTACPPATERLCESITDEWRPISVRAETPRAAAARKGMRPALEPRAGRGERHCAVGQPQEPQDAAFGFQPAIASFRLLFR